MNEIHPGGNARSYICQCLCSARWTSALIVAVPFHLHFPFENMKEPTEQGGSAVRTADY